MFSFSPCHASAFRTGTFAARWISTAFRTTKALLLSSHHLGTVTLSQPSFRIHRTDSCAHTHVHGIVCTVKHTRWTERGCRSCAFTPRLNTTNSEPACECVWLRRGLRSRPLSPQSLRCVCVRFDFTHCHCLFVVSETTKNQRQAAGYVSGAASVCTDSPKENSSGIRSSEMIWNVKNVTLNKHEVWSV